jgi:hypothetical protein
MWKAPAAWIRNLAGFKWAVGTIVEPQEPGDDS